MKFGSFLCESLAQNHLNRGLPRLFDHHHWTCLSPVDLAHSKLVSLFVLAKEMNPGITEMVGLFNTLPPNKNYLLACYCWDHLGPWKKGETTKPVQPVCPTVVLLDTVLVSGGWPKIYNETQKTKERNVTSHNRRPAKIWTSQISVSSGFWKHECHNTHLRSRCLPW